MKIALFCVLAMLSLCACNGIVKSRIWAQDQLIKAASTKDGIQGVLGYYQRPVLETDEMTQLVDKDGKFISTTCNHVLVQKIVNITDYEHPVEIWYEPGLLEANKFSAQLSNSVFSAVNSESTPDQGKTLLNLTEAAGNLAKIARPSPAAAPLKPGPPTKELPDCNAAPSFVQYAPIPSIPLTAP